MQTSNNEQFGRLFKHSRSSQEADTVGGGINTAIGAGDTPARPETAYIYAGAGTGAAAAINSIKRREIDIVTIVPYEFCVLDA